MSAKIGQQVQVQITSGRWSQATVVHIVTGDEVHLIAFADATDPWPTVEVPNGLTAGTLRNVTKGTSVGQWKEVDVTDPVTTAIADAIDGISGFTTTAEVNDAIEAAQAGYATEVYVDAGILAAISGIPEDDDSGLCSVPGPGGAVSSPALSTPRRPSTNRPTRITAYLTVAMTSTLLGAQSATVELHADSGATPTTVAGGPLVAALSGVAASSTIPMTLTYDLPAGHYYQIVKTANTGTPTVTITHINETIL